MNQLIFSETPEVTIATNTFINVPVILKFDDTNLIEIVKEENVGYTTSIPIYHSDGTHLAKVNGNRIFLTEDGKKSGLSMDKKSNVWECKMDTKTLFEIHQNSANSFKTVAELYTPTGHFVKFTENPNLELFDTSLNNIRINGFMMQRSTMSGFKIAFWLKNDGSLSVGCN